MSATLLAEDRPVARKTHRCGNCEGLILPGTRYRSQRVAGDGTVRVHREHEACHALYWRLHGEWGLDPDDWVDPDSVRDAYYALFELMAWGAR